MPTTSVIAESIEATLPTAVRAIIRLSRAAEKVLTTFRLTTAQYRILDRLVDGTAAGSSLADWLAVKPPSVTALVDGLVKRQLVQRAVDPIDRRRVTHSITAEGIALHATVAHEVAVKLREVVSEMSDARTERSMLDALSTWNVALDRARERRTTGPAR